MPVADLITPDWPVAAHIRAYCSTRHGGVSQAPFDSLNLGTHVGDAPEAVKQNHRRFKQMARLPADPLWLTQKHGTTVINSQNWYSGCEADAIFADIPGHVCTVLSADCLPVLLCDKAGQQIAAVHAGWRGLLAGVIENTVRQFRGPHENILAWLGPAIGPQQFEVGSEVFQAFTRVDNKAAVAFRQTDAEHYLADIFQLARQRLNKTGITQVSGGDLCTVSDPEHFFSYRRDGQTGRMATVIWMMPK
ncbi:peptidoglycan editing factor PgeF [Methylophaga sp. OBS4]|uniref:peptidoglycan editing factor PgeF n=1 Tax=Methylophaga sp. OBS4 TaxID=2991935 RepID=UPI00224F5C6E|nr:peptidoglycan editing factor PgeF [Methylophaga sp. OBS4]MCX4187631.1 peptidoglycan editing factor PgeF [Methylophaga sp. OBS4]